MNYVGLSKYDTANGPGIRVSLFVSGCTLHCKGCFNPDSWKFDAGNELTPEVENEIIKELNHDWIDGFSLLGGDPFEPEFELQLSTLLKRIKEETGKNIWCWTGRRLDKVKNSALIPYIDTLVDGPFIESKKITEEWRGSSNQRIIYLKKI